MYIEPQGLCVKSIPCERGGGRGSAAPVRRRCTGRNI